jgi:hypothetical protein
MSSDASIRSTVDSSKKRYCRIIGKDSDHLAVAMACREFRALQSSRCGTRKLRNYCAENGLSFDTVLEILNLQNDLLDSLASIGFIKSTKSGLDDSEACNANCLKSKVLSAALCAGFYPQLVSEHRIKCSFLILASHYVL